MIHLCTIATLMFVQNNTSQKILFIAARTIQFPGVVFKVCIYLIVCHRHLKYIFRCQKYPYLSKIYISAIICQLKGFREPFGYRVVKCIFCNILDINCKHFGNMYFHALPTPQLLGHSTDFIAKQPNTATIKIDYSFSLLVKIFSVKRRSRSDVVH